MCIKFIVKKKCRNELTQLEIVVLNNHPMDQITPKTGAIYSCMYII